jgi:DinB superfamily
MTRGAVMMVALLACSGPALAQGTPEEKSVSQVLDSDVKMIEGEFVSAAEAMPEDKYGFAPANGEFKGVRTFAAQVKHVAAVNYLVGAAILGEKPPVDTGGESGPSTLTSKADIVSFAKQSFEYAHKAVASITAANATQLVQSPFGDNKTTRLGLASVFAWHGFDHYGQMAVYLRMNGIIPPASRGQ